MTVVAGLLQGGLWAVLLINTALLTVFTLLQCVSFLPRYRWAEREQVTTEAVTERSNSRVVSIISRELISVHLPVHAEPPELVIATLNALARLDDEAFEVIVLDNNTDQPGLWRPVAEHCCRLGSRFHFHRVAQLAGAKAGALNEARRHASPRARWIAVVDADYQVAPFFLSRCRDALTSDTTGELDVGVIDYVQFPQAYRVNDARRSATSLELSDYFERVAVAADRAGSMLLTGTVCCISVPALDRVGGWPSETITEDADLGARLLEEGFVGRYVGQEVGCGQLPPTLTALECQRDRWIVGNLQVLRRLLRQGGRGGTNPALWLQLTAWCSFVSVPACVLLGWQIGLLSGVVLAPTSALLLLASASVLVQAVLTLQLSLSQPCERWRVAAVRWALSLSAGWATLKGLAGVSSHFERTPRGGEPEIAGARRHGVLTAASMMLLVFSAPDLPWYAILASALLIGSYALLPWLDSDLRGSALIDGMSLGPTLQEVTRGRSDQYRHTDL